MPGFRKSGHIFAVPGFRYILEYQLVSLLRHSIYSIEMPLSIFQPRIHHEVINNCTLFALPAALVLAYNGEFYGSQKFNLPNLSVLFPIYFTE